MIKRFRETRAVVFNKDGILINSERYHHKVIDKRLPKLVSLLINNKAMELLGFAPEVRMKEVYFFLKSGPGWQSQRQ